MRFQLEDFAYTIALESHYIIYHYMALEIVYTIFISLVHAG